VSKTAERPPVASPWPVYVGESARHGKGLFAARRIKADALIIALEGVPTTEDGIYVLWWEDEEGDHAMEVTNDARYVNHAAEPNAAYYDDGVYALRDIEAGEEITHHYGDSWDDVS
jgi:SET domain-containing protein